MAPNKVGSAWHGGEIYFDNLIALLSESGDVQVDLVIIATERNESQFEKEISGLPLVYLSNYVEKEEEKLRQERENTSQLLLKERKQRRKQRKGWHRFFRKTKRREPDKAFPSTTAPLIDGAAFQAMVREHQLDFVFPLPATACRPGIQGAAWIPDLQHCFLPEFFDPADLKSRNEKFEAFSKAEVVVFSSEASRSDFRKMYPESGAKLKVWSFCSYLPPDLLLSDPSEVVKKYHLPEPFFLVANQFWKHKDHAIVVEALIRLRKEGLSVPVVFTGALRDYRGTGHVDQFLQSIQRGGVHDSVHLLGFLDREEQLHLMRSALAVVQPSRFEGWSTVVEDCKAIGQRLILSDLDVHHEQAPPNSKYFRVGDPAALTHEIRECFTDRPSEWLESRASREEKATSALMQTRKAARRRFLEIVAQQDTTREETEGA